MNIHELNTIILGIITALTSGFIAYFKTKKGRTKTIAYLKRLFNLDLTADDLRSSIENMSVAIDAQGNSINWLTQSQDNLINQINIYKEELSEAKEKLKQMEDLHIENVQLKQRVAELEEQVKNLEKELERRKKYTPKKYLGDENEK